MNNLIEKLGTKTICDCSGYRQPCTCPKFEPILIGTVLEKIKPRVDGMSLANKIVDLWGWCGFTSSLQEIMEDGTECLDPECKCGKFPLRNDSCPYKLKPEAKALIDFLNEIF